jgi:hypothetical protein
MTRLMLENRILICLALSAVGGAAGVSRWPFPGHEPVLEVIRDERPSVYAVFLYGYITLWFSSTFLVAYIGTALLTIFAAPPDEEEARQALPPYPNPRTRQDLCLVLGERHHRTTATPASQPQWLTIPERGLYTGLIIVGAIGTGKTSACMYPYLEQLLAYRAGDPARRLGGLVLEVKGDFCAHVRDILARHGRADDYVEISLTSVYRYNPLHNDLDAYALAYGIATLMTNLFGRGKEPFWQQASTNLVKFVILLHQVLDDYVTLFQVYEHVINPDKLRVRIADGERRFASDGRRLIVDSRAIHARPELEAWGWQPLAGDEGWTYWSAECRRTLDELRVTYRTEVPGMSADEARRRAQFAAVKRWFEDDWMRIEPKLRTSIVEGVSVFLSLFDDNPDVKHTFCPPKATYDSAANPDGRHGVPLPPIRELIEQGKVLALNFPVAMNPGLARALGTMLKQDFQRAVLGRVSRMSTEPGRTWRPVVFLCDEYQAFATTGENDPSGDEKFFSLARQARCIPIVATQSISSLRSTLTGEAWRTLLQGLRTKIFLALSDDFSATMAAELCGKAEHLKEGYTLSETSHDARVSLLTGRPSAHRATVSASKSYHLRYEFVFQPKVFAELQNAQAIALAYDGLNPQPPTYCYLKPYYLKVQTSYFDHVVAGDL